MEQKMSPREARDIGWSVPSAGEIHTDPLSQAVMASPATSELSYHPGTLVVGHTLTSMGKPIPHLGLVVL